jgi:hypothetical protein
VPLNFFQHAIGINKTSAVGLLFESFILMKKEFKGIRGLKQQTYYLLFYYFILVCLL